jgi:hypothetical protein
MMPPSPPPPPQPEQPPQPEDQLLQVLDSMDQADDGDLKEMLSQFDEKTITLLKGAAKSTQDQFPDLYDRIVQLQADLKSPGPKYPDDYPSWFRKPAKPTTGTVSGLAHADESEYSDYRTRVHRVREWMTMRRMGVFTKRNRKRDEPWQSPRLLNEYQMRASIIGRADTIFDMQPLHPSVREDAQNVEDFAYWAWERIKEQHVERMNGPLEVDDAKYAIDSGMIVYRCLMNPANSKFPWKVELLDPTTVYAVPGGEQGLLRATRVYRTSIIKAIDAFDLDGKLGNKLLAKKKDRNGDVTEPKMTDQVEVVEYYDRWWMVVTVAGIPAITTEHKYGYVPFIVQPNAHGSPLSSVKITNSNVRNPAFGLEGSIEVANWYHWAAGDLDAEIKSHEQYEAIMGKYASAIRRSDDPPWKRKVSPLGNKQGNRGIELQDGAVNPELMDQEEYEPILVGPAPQMAQPILAARTQDEVTGLLSDTRFGAAAPNQSGNAISGLNAADQDKLFGAMKCCELARQRLIRMMLRQMQDWGDLLGEDGKRGKVVVPYQPNRRDTNDVAFELTAEIVQAVGTDIMVTLKPDETQEFLAKINAANLGIQSEIVSRRWSRDFIGIQDPAGMESEIIEEGALSDPRMRDLYILANFLERAGMTHVLPPEFWAQAWMKNYMGQQQQQQGGGGPPNGGAPMPQPGVNTSALNLQPLGQGQQGPTGAPGMTPPPPGGMTLPPGSPVPGLGPGGIGA